MSLTIEHLDDLRHSGLSDATILACQFEAVRPQDIKLHGVNSAYRLKYFDLAGRPNCAERWKLFPALTGPNGTQKYHQAPGTSPALYMPPLLSWDEIARDAHIPLVITEGEKKAAAACQRGLVTLGIAGVWNWRQRLDTGERLTLSALDQFVWPGRSVLLGSDSDAWRPDKLLSVLSGFYALGQELISRGATVRLVRLPERAGVKVGLDDWLVAAGNLWETEWAALERISLDAQQLASVAKWWQGWREKQTVDAHFRSTDAESVETSVTGGLYRVSFPSHRCRFEFDRLTESRGGVSAELTVHLGATELLGETDIGLKADSARDKIAKTLKGLADQIPWKRLLERACTTVLKAHRVGSPVVMLQPTEDTTPHVPFIINPLVYRNHQTLAFAPGGSCKSFLALYLALLVSHGSQQAGVSALKSPVLYLDWELDEATVKGRVKSLQLGHTELRAAVPFYRHCEYPLHQEAHHIASLVAELGVQFLVIDSAAMACGGDLTSPDSAIKLQRALRTIGCASLVLAHVPKSIQEGQESSAYGTVFFRELARNVWELQRAGTESPARVALHQKKNNFGPNHASLGFELTFDGPSVSVAACDPIEEPAFEEKLPIAARIRNLLEQSDPLTAEEIAERLHVNLSSVKSVLSRHKGFKWQMIGGQGQETRWTVLRAT